MRLVNHCLSDLVLFFLAHPYAPAEFAAGVCVVLVVLMSADFVLARRRRHW